MTPKNFVPFWQWNRRVSFKTMTPEQLGSGKPSFSPRTLRSLQGAAIGRKARREHQRARREEKRQLERQFERQRIRSKFRAAVAASLVLGRPTA